MDIVRHIRTNISSSLLYAFCSVVVFSVLSLVLTMNALRVTKDAQNSLTEKTLPLLNKTQSFSKSIFDYLNLLDEIIKERNISQTEYSLENVLEYEEELKSNLQELLGFTIHQKPLFEIKKLLDDIFISSEKIWYFSVISRKEQLEKNIKGTDRIRKLLKDIRGTILKHKVNENTQKKQQDEKLSKIQESLIKIDSAMSQYNTQFILSDLQYLKTRYINAVREISNQVINIQNSKLKKKIAFYTANLLDESTTKTGFFNLANLLIKNKEIIEELRIENKKREKEINELLGSILETASINAEYELKGFDELVQKNIKVVVACLSFIFVLAFAIFYFYIIPYITRRLIRLTKDTQSIASGNYDIDIDIRGNDEITQVAKALNLFRMSLIEKQKIEKDREELINRLTSSNEQLERFAFICSHDLQEPLRMVRSFSEKLENHFRDHLKDDEKGQKYFNFVSDGAIRSQALISDILEYSRIDNDAKKLEKIDLFELISGIKKTMRVSFDESNAVLIYDELPVIRGNKTQLVQLFQNLINNAIKYRKKDCVPKIDITCESQNLHWKFIVRDNGIGIEKRHSKKVFEVFKRLHHKGDYPGTGIGLAICKKIVERHGGKIWLESEYGQYSAFYFTILK